MTTIAPVITVVHRFTIVRKSRNECGPMKTSTIPSLGLPPIFAALSSSFATISKISTSAALGATVESTNIVVDVTIVDVWSSSKRTEDSLFFTAHRLKTMEFLLVSRKWCGKQTPASGFAHKPQKEDPKTSGNSSVVVWKQLQKIIAPRRHASLADVERVCTIL